MQKRSQIILPQSLHLKSCNRWEIDAVFRQGILERPAYIDVKDL